MSSQGDFEFDELDRAFNAYGAAPDDVIVVANKIMLDACVAIGNNGPTLDSKTKATEDHPSITAAHMVSQVVLMLMGAVNQLAESVDCMAAMRGPDELPTSDESAVMFEALREQWLKAHPVHDVEVYASALRRFEHLAGR